MSPCVAYLPEPLAGVTTFAQYTDWIKGLMTIMPSGNYQVKSFATDAERNSVAAYGAFSRTAQVVPSPYGQETVSTMSR